MSKKKVIYLFGEINNENISVVIDTADEREKVTLYLNSAGGFVIAALTLIDFINNFEGEFEIVATYQVTSSAFLIFVLTKCKKRILPITWAEVHEISIEQDTRELKINQMEKDRSKETEIKEVYSKILSPEEMEEFKNGKDIALDRKRLSEVVGKFGYKEIDRVLEGLLRAMILDILDTVKKRSK